MTAKKAPPKDTDIKIIVIMAVIATGLFGLYNYNSKLQREANATKGATNQEPEKKCEPLPTPPTNLDGSTYTNREILSFAVERKYVPSYITNSISVDKVRSGIIEPLRSLASCVSIIQ